MLAKDFRQRAWNALHGRWVIAVITGLVASILGGGVASYQNSGLHLNFNFGSLDTFYYSFSAGNWGIAGLVGALLPLLLGAGMVFVVWFLVSLVIGGAVSLGYAQFNLDVADGRELRIETLFSCFSRLGAGVVMRLLTGLFTFLWSLLLIVPGVIAAYRYAMTPYILAEHPEMRVRDAIEASKKLMRGNKFRLFCLQFSFIGWHFLSALTFGVLGLWVRPYTEATNAVFYREISGTANRREANDGYASDGWSYGSSWENSQ